MSTPQAFLTQAIELAIENVRSGQGGPFGALVVKEGKILATGVNRVVEGNDPTAHAEIVALREACRILGSFQLTDCEVYASCEPCPMCLGAIYWARPAALYYAATKEDAGRCGFDDSMIYEELSLPVAKRRIRTLPMPLPNALESFRAWSESRSRVEY